MAAPLPPAAAAATAATRPGPSVTTAAVGTRREPLLRLRSLERRGPLGPSAPAQPAPGASASVPDALDPWVSGGYGRWLPGLSVETGGCPRVSGFWKVAWVTKRGAHRGRRLNRTSRILDPACT